MNIRRKMLIFPGLTMGNSRELRPFHHQKLLDRTHAQKGRWFPLEYVLPILDLLEEVGVCKAQLCTDRSAARRRKYLK